MRRNLVEFLVAAVATTVLRRYSPLDAADPFHGVLSVLPLGVAALRTIGRAARRSSGQNSKPARSTMDGVVLGALVLLTLGRTGLGLAATDGLLAASFLSLLGYHIARLLPLLRATLGRRLPTSPPWIFWALPAATYLLLLPWSMAHRQPDGDEPFYLLLTHSLAHDGDADLANNYQNQDWRHFMQREIEPQPGDPLGEDGQLYSRHNLLLPLLLAPTYRLAGLGGAQVSLALLAAWLAWMVLRLACRLAPERPRGALLAWALVAFSPPLVVFSQQVWIEVPAALLLALAVDRILLLGHRGQHGDLRPGDLWRLLLPLGLLPLLKLRLGLVALPLLLLAWHRGRASGPLPKRRALAVLGVLVAAILWFNWARFGNPLKIHNWSELGLLEQPLTSYLKGGLGMFWDVAFGLFAVAPIWLLLLPALWSLAHHQRRWLAAGALLALPYLTILAPRLEWYGGWSPAFRYPLVFLPLLGVALVPLLDRRRLPGLRAVGVALSLTTLALTVIWLLIPGWTYNFADGRNHLLDATSARLGTDMARWFPSMVRPRLATWLWPVLSLLLIPITLGLRRLPRRAAAGWGLAGLLVVWAAVPLIASNWPTGRVEVEDPQVRKIRGQPFPQTWALRRAQKHGGWMLYQRCRVETPVTPGGRRVRLRARVRFVENRLGTPLQLEVLAGDSLLATWTASRNRRWQTLDLGTFDWPDEATLVLRLPTTAPLGAPRNGLIVDWLDFDWQ